MPTIATRKPNKAASINIYLSYIFVKETLTNIFDISRSTFRGVYQYIKTIRSFVKILNKNEAIDFFFLIYKTIIFIFFFIFKESKKKIAQMFSFCTHRLSGLIRSCNTSIIPYIRDFGNRRVKACFQTFFRNNRPRSFFFPISHLHYREAMRMKPLLNIHTLENYKQGRSGLETSRLASELDPASHIEYQVPGHYGHPTGGARISHRPYQSLNSNRSIVALCEFYNLSCLSTKGYW